MKASELYNQMYYIKCEVLSQLSNSIYSRRICVTLKYERLYELKMTSQVEQHLEIQDRQISYGPSTRLKTRERDLLCSNCSTFI